MINKKLIKSAVIITAVMLSLGGCAGGCGKQEQPVSAEPTETVSEEESAEESLEETPSPTATPTTEPEEESPSSEESLDNSENESETTEEQEEDLGYEIISVDDKIMYATQNCNLRQGPGTDYEKVGGLSYAQEITVNGKVETEEGKLWWVLKTEDGSIQMVSGGLVSETKPVKQTTPSSGGNGSSGNGGGGTTQQPSGGTTQQPSGGGNGGSQPPADDGGGFDSGWGGLTDVGGMQDFGGNGGWTVE